MPAKIVYSNSFEAKRKRIERLPQFYGDMMMGAIKGNMVGLIETFQKGIRSNDFGLEPLKEQTIKQKKYKGFSMPEVPLYGKGDERQKDSYINMLRLTEIKNGWKVWVSKAQHWSKKISLYDLFVIHENGATITKGDKAIKIPKRPAFMLAYTRWMSKRGKNRKETSRMVKKAITDYINKASTTSIQKLADIKKKRHEAEE